MTDFDPREARLSEWALCPRACACRIAGCEPALPTEHQMRYMRRGQLFEEYVARQFVERYGATAVIRQLEIKWPLGAGHADIWLPGLKLLIEVFSTTGGNLDRKIKQVKLYGYFFPEAESLAVYVVDPSTLEREEIIPVRLTDWDRADIETELEALLAAKDGGDLPPCVFDSPSACKFAGCSFTESAWEGWQEELYELDGEAVAIAADLWAVDKLLREAKAKAALHEEQAKALKAKLAEAGVGPGREYLLGPYKVRRTVVGPSSTFSLSLATKAGFALPEYLQPFVKIGEGHERFTIRETMAG